MMLMRANCPHAASSFETPRNGAVDGDGVGTVAGEFVVAGAGATVGWLRGQNITAKITTTISAAIACQKRLSWKKSIATSRIGAVATCVGCDRLSGGARLSDHRARRQFVAKLICCLATLLALAAAVDFGHAQAVGDPKRRPRLGAAGLLAVSRATVAGQVRSPNSRAPRFPDLATTPGMTSTALLVALTTPHAGMPMFTFTGEQREDIIAYILSLH